MIIGVDTRFLSRGKIEPVTPVSGAMLQAITSEHLEDHFYFFSDREWSAAHPFPANVTAVTLPLRGPASLGRRYWLDVALPKALRQYRVEACLFPGGEVSMRTTIPQLMVWKGSQYAGKTGNRFAGFFGGDSERKAIQKAHCILVASPHEKEVVSTRWKKPAARVQVIGTTISNAFQPVDAGTRQAVKNSYTDGREYFICLEGAAGIDPLVTLLKAFSLFKKRQHSSWKLLLPGAFAFTDTAFTELLKTYKYKEDIVVPGAVGEEEGARILAASYAAIATPKRGRSDETICAMKCGIPCLAEGGDQLFDNQQGGILPIDWADPGPVAEALMLIYKDELLHQRLSREALATASAFAPEKTAGLVWRSLVESAASGG
jgi:glycosyltransferase involved in cell wall biosynthesis